MQHKLYKVTLTGFLLLTNAGFSFAQTPVVMVPPTPTDTTVTNGNTGTIKIGVADQNGNMLGARVEVQDPSNGTIVANGDTGTSGGAVVLTLPVGGYAVIAKKEGYAQIEIIKLKLQPGQNDTIIITMKGGSIAVPPIPMPPTRVCPFEDIMTLKRGVSNDVVKKLQEFVGLPASSQTGYFGPATEQKVKEKQLEYRLPQTGIVDDSVRPLFFPCYQLLVLSPNGGETFKTGQVIDVNFAIEAPFVQTLPVPMPLPALPEGDRIQSQSAPKAGVKELKRSEMADPSPAIAFPFSKPLPANLSVDLIQYGNIVAHIADVAIYGGKQSVSWAIPKYLQTGAYRVRVSAHGKPIYYLTPEAKEKLEFAPEWRGFLWDESDDYFTIVAGDVTPPPPPQNPKLKEQVQQLMRLVEEMLRVLKEINVGL